MEKLKVCFTGIGSIAKRHVRNLRSVAAGREISIQIDAFRRSGALAEGVNNVFTKLSDVPNDYDVVFITNPTEMHLDTLKQFHEKGKNFFIEKPVVSLNQIEDAKSLKTKSDTVYYVACPLRYNAVIQYVKENINPSDVISVRSISSSYLPDWRSGQDYRETYSAHKDMGGGVSIDLIHEWDYLTDIFGWPQKIHSFIGKKSDLEIDSDDYAIYIAEYPGMISELHLDYFGRKTIREIQLFTKEDTLIGDIAHNRLQYLKSGKTIVFHEERDNYQRRELETFLDMISGVIPVDDGFHHGLEVLELTQGRLMT